MNGSFNTTGFVLGMALAKDLPRNEAATTGLAASMFPAGNLFGAVMLKPLIDARAEADARAKRAEEALAAATPVDPKSGAPTSGLAVLLETFAPRSSNGFSRSTLWGGPGGGGGTGGSSGGSGFGMGAFGSATLADSDNRELRRRLAEREEAIEDLRTQHRKEIQRIQEETGDQVRGIQRAAEREFEERREQLEDQARELQRQLRREQEALAERSNALDIRERRLEEAELPAKGGKKYQA